ncbi:MAG TPA: serine/threonine-protein kinase [Thermoanaerobaculia bacterium]|nr:serine/threonine-protein kinase [Thermoanaerobaculia bacterium]
MRWISDEAMSRLREVADAPDFSGTRYRIERELGRGGMGVVWAATDLELQREVAVKVLPAWESSEDAAARLRSEARILAQLEHPGIVPIHDLGQLADGRIFYAMKLVRGERLDSYLDRSALPLQERLRLFERFCEPVAFAHARGIAHRDLKPANVMVGSFGEILVLDWGLAGGSDSPRSGGTTGYMAPEQETGGPVDARADVHALGAILIVICGDDKLSRPVAAIIARATAVDPKERYADASALARDVTLWLDGMPVEAYRESVFERAGRWLGRHRTLVALVVAYLIMRALVIVFFGH